MKYYILFGPPGAGKGTQAALLRDKHNLCHLSTGELLRAEIAAGTALGAKAKELIDNGMLVPDEVVEAMIENKFDTTGGVSGFLLDGFPRTVAQADALKRILARRGQKVDAVLSIMIPDSTIRERIRHRAEIEGRADDASEATISNRIATYHAKTEPLISYYKDAGLYREIDGTGIIDEVNAALSALMQVASSAPLPYAPDALAPIISKETIDFHYGKHLKTYVDNLNNLVKGTAFENMSLEEVVCKGEGGIRNNAGQVLNHNLYFTQFCPASDYSAPDGKLLEAISGTFGSYDGFVEKFSAAAASLFGSGWAWLSADADGRLVITQEANAANPVQKGLKPLLTIDVWEHAYYIDYRNARPAYIKALMQIINWKEISRRYEA